MSEDAKQKIEEMRQLVVELDKVEEVIKNAIRELRAMRNNLPMAMKYESDLITRAIPYSLESWIDVLERKIDEAQAYMITLRRKIEGG
jgi:flagellar biosynthesis chaperone FliJ